MAAGQGKHFVKVCEGLSLFGRAFDGREMTLELYAKTRDLDGAFRVEITTPVQLVSRELRGTTEGWERIALKLAPKPTDPWMEVQFVVDAERGAGGTVWIDDLSFLPSQ